MVAIRSWKYAPILMFAALGGCAGMREGPAPISQVTATELDGLRDAIRSDCLNLASSAPAPANPRVRRNHLITAFMAAADTNYTEYERNLLAFSRQNELGGSLATLLLSAIGGASGSQDLSRAANITSGVVAGTQTAFAKSLLNQTVSVLQTHMRAERATQAAQIIEHLALPYDQWNTCLALREAIAYEHAGTLNAALAAMAASATDEEREGDADEDQAIQRIAYRTDALAVGLAAYLRTGENQRGTAREAVVELINEGFIPGPTRNAAQILRQFRAGSGTPEQRIALAQRIVRKENGSEAGNALRAALPPQ